MHSIHYNYAHASFESVWKKNNQREMDYTLRNLTDYTLPLPKIESFRKCPLYSFPYEWNNLKNEIKCQHNKTTFKIALTNELFNQINNDN